MLPRRRKKINFINPFEDVLQSARAHDLQVVIGDFNTRVGNVRNDFELFLGPHAIRDPSLHSAELTVSDPKLTSCFPFSRCGVF